jgi:hypothetical protein
MNCDNRRDQILLYLTDGLDQADREELETHLQGGCPRCLAELSVAREIVGWLPLALSPERPPDSVKERLFDRIRPEHGDRDSGLGVSLVSRTIPVATGQPAEPRPVHRVRSPRVTRRRRFLFTYVITPIVAAALAIAATYGVMRSELMDSRSRLAGIEGEIAGMRDALSQSKQELAELRRVDELRRDLWNTMQSDHSRLVHLRDANNNRTSLARLLVDAERRVGIFFPGKHCPLVLDNRYALLLYADENGDPIRAAEFTFFHSHPTRMELELPEDADRYTRIGIRQLLNDAVEDNGPDETILFGVLRDTTQ